MARFFQGLFGSSKQTSPPATALRLNSAVQGQPIPLLLGGAQRMGGVVIDYYNFNFVQSSSSSSGGGKGGITGGGSKGQSGGYQYYVSFVMAHCEGPLLEGEVNGVGGLGSAFWFNGSPSFSQGGTAFQGDYAQEPWSYTESIEPGHALAYRGIGYMGWPNFSLGSSPSLPNITATCVSSNNSFVPGQLDGDPSVALSAFLTNPNWGVGFPSARLGALSGNPSSWQAYCAALGFGVSPAIASSVQASSICNDMTDATNSAACWQDGLLTVVPYGDTAVQQGEIEQITETHVVPDNDFNSIAVGNLGNFVADKGVSYDGGGPLGLVAYPTTTTGTYAQMGGVYYFNVGDVGQTVLISYTYAAAASYVPNTAVIYDFTIDDFLPNQGTIGTGLSTHNSPLIVVRQPRDQMLNDIKVEYLDRNNSYNPIDIEIKDSASIVAFGRTRPSEIKQYHFFCLASAAAQSAALQLVRAQVARQYQFTVGKHFILILELMAVATVTMPQMGLTRQPIRIIEIQENDDQTLTVTGEDFPGTASVPVYGTQAAAGYGPQYNQDPGLINAPLIFEPSDELGSALISGGGLMIAGALSGASPALWGGCQVWASYDGENYTPVGTINGSARMGVLTATLPAVTPSATGQTIDTVDTLAVDLTESAGTLASGTELDATSLNTRCIIGPLNGAPGAGSGEIVAFATAILTAVSKYDLTYLVRGAYSTEDEIASWPAGTGFARLDQGIFTVPYDQSRIGATIYLKFVSFNIWQGGQQSLADVPAYTYVIQGLALASPLPDITGLTSAFVSGRLTLTWDIIDDFRPAVRYEIRQGDTFEGALSLGTVAHPPFILPGNGTFWVTGWCQPAPGLVVRSEQPVSITVAGATLTTNVIATFDCKAAGWPGTFTGGAGVDSQINAVRTGGAGNILSETSILADPDLLNLGGNQNGTYTPAFVINAGRVCPITVTISMTGTGVPVGQNILDTLNILAMPDFLGSASTAFVDISANLLISQSGPGSLLSEANLLTDPNVLNYGIPFAPAQAYTPGDYLGQVIVPLFDLGTVDPNTIGYLLSAVITAQLQARIDHVLTNGTVPSTGLIVAFTPDGSSTPAPFNGGPNDAPVPAITATWGDQKPGDVLAISGLTLAGCTIEIQNGGIGVQRNQVTIYAEGY